MQPLGANPAGRGARRGLCARKLTVCTGIVTRCFLHSNACTAVRVGGAGVRVSFGSSLTQLTSACTGSLYAIPSGIPSQLPLHAWGSRAATSKPPSSPSILAKNTPISPPPPTASQPPSTTPATHGPTAHAASPATASFYPPSAVFICLQPSSSWHPFVYTVYGTAPRAVFSEPASGVSARNALPCIETWGRPWGRHHVQLLQNYRYCDGPNSSVPYVCIRQA